ncbi:hypothetical protein L228DRAFT_271792 [Xylona heveae TC161]|uniref:Uncharacterized protein n=1 Tax=Xylona heveae (strain CBS 132557 / TC161) TaxID=1328760 RepID=A0A164ZBE2_XYLHT|nr:hypothetical protein L228DRAFT_271792 [Xylona heveae TC161]KZF18895.1 hypothetical protein L228DRAFT_271792 [Xylona heveae TC161]
MVLVTDKGLEVFEVCLLELSIWIGAVLSVALGTPFGPIHLAYSPLLGVLIVLVLQVLGTPIPSRAV